MPPLGISLVLFNYRTGGRVHNCGIQKKQFLHIRFFTFIFDPIIHFSSPGTRGANKHQILFFGKLRQGGIAAFIVEIVDEYMFRAIEVTCLVLEWRSNIHEGYICRLFSHDFFEKFFIDGPFLFAGFNRVYFIHRQLRLRPLRGRLPCGHTQLQIEAILPIKKIISSLPHPLYNVFNVAVKYGSIFVASFIHFICQAIIGFCILGRSYKNHDLILSDICGKEFG